MVLGANTFRQFLQMLGPSTEESEVGDPSEHPDEEPADNSGVDDTRRTPQLAGRDPRERGRRRRRRPAQGGVRGAVALARCLSMNRALMAAGLVDRVQVTLFPVITGQTGVDPIFQGAADFDLELIDSRTLDGHIVATYLLRFDERSRQRRARLMPWRRLQCRSSECLLLSGAIAQRLPVPLAFRRPTHRPVSRQADDSKCQGRLQGQQRRRTNL